MLEAYRGTLVRASLRYAASRPVPSKAICRQRWSDMYKSKIEIGDQFDHLTAVGDGGGGMWWFLCSCGEKCRFKESSVRSNAKGGWASCRECYFKNKESIIQNK